MSNAKGHHKGSAAPTVSREQVRAMLRQMLPELKLTFHDEKADEALLTQPTFVELSSDELEEDDVRHAQLNALDRLDRTQGRVR